MRVHPFTALTLLTLALGATTAAAVAGGSARIDRARTADVQVRGVPDTGIPAVVVPNGAPAVGVTRPGAEADAKGSRARGAAWLKQHQHADGGWGAGAWGQQENGAPSDVATTCVTVVALMRDGLPAHRDAVTRGARFVAGVVERSPAEGPRLATPEGTQPQYKLGPLVDTHLAALMLGDVAGQLDAESNALVDRALDKVVSKVQAAQAADGSFETAGWAPVLSSSIAAQGLVRAQELGKSVSKDVLDRSDEAQAKQVDVRNRSFDASKGAGIELYAVASSLRGNAQAAARGKVENAPAAEAAAARVAADADGRLVAGFGSLGGEEMLAYTMISDTLAEKGGEGWSSWEKKIGAFLSATQNADGSWTGHHCITSTTFTTAAAVMSLGAEDAAQARIARAKKSQAVGMK